VSDHGSETPATEDEVAELLTFLIADVRGWTVFTQERGDEAAARLARRFATLAREVVASRGGDVIELRGDEALAVFQSARRAIRAAVDLQVRFARETRDDPTLPLPVGIGLDAGEAVRVEGGYRGGALNLAARLCSKASAGEILATQEVVHLARKVDGVRYEDHGALELKGLAEPVRTVRVSPDGEDPAAVMAPYAPVKPPEPMARRRPWPLRSPLRIAATGIVVALIAAGIPFVLSKGGPPLDLGGNAVAILDAQSGDVVGAVDLDTLPGPIAAGGGAVWVADVAGVVSRIDVQTHQVTPIPVGQDLSAIAYGDGAVWVTSAADGTLTRISPETNPPSIVETIPVGAGPTGIAFGGGAIWVANRLDDTVVRVTDNGEIDAVVPVTGSPSGLAYADDTVWVTNASDGAVSRIDAKTATLTDRISVGNGPGDIATGGGAVWVANRLDGTVSEIETDANRVIGLDPTGDGTTGITAGAGAVWVGSEGAGTITKLGGDSAPAVFDLDAAVVDVALAGDQLWVSSRGSPTGHEGGTLTVVARGISSLDPALMLESWLPTLLGNGLVGFKRVAGVDGSSLIPDLATSIPRPTEDGTSYTFQLRPNVVYANGDPVVASDIRRAIERAFVVKSFYTGELMGIVGADACFEATSCDLSDGIDVDDTSTLTFHLVEPDPNFLFALAEPAAFPVPPGTPDHVGNQPIVGTGPYEVDSYVPHEQLDLVRNERFDDWAGDRPGPYADRIVVRLGVADGDFADEVAAGRADYVGNPPLIPPEDLDALMTEHPELLHTYRRVGTFHFFLNTRLPPFDDVDVRRAVNFAVDRREVLERFPFPGSSITCQIVPPGSPGYRPTCPYTIDANPAGTYTARDLERAKDLVAAARVGGTNVTVWEFPAYVNDARYFVSVLDDLGFDAQLKVIDDPDKFFFYVFDSRNDVQTAGLSLNGGPVATPEDALFPITCDAFVPADPERNANAAEFCDPSIDRRIEHAREVQLADPAAALPLWADIDHDVTEQAPWVALATPGWVDVVSQRLGNYEASPIWGILLDQAWVR
jgi:peptide/nickel transport system substrate-binding protein